MKEVKKGFIEGPMDLEFLPEGAILTRRFGVKQKTKTHPIDNYKSSFVNSSQRATVQKCTTRKFFRLGQWPQLRTAFLRVSLVLWKFGTKLLNLIWSTISSPLRTWNPVVPLTW